MLRLRECGGVQSIHSTISYFALFSIHRLYTIHLPHSSFSSSLIHSTGEKLYIFYYTIFLTDCTVAQKTVHMFACFTLNHPNSNNP